MIPIAKARMMKKQRKTRKRKLKMRKMRMERDHQGRGTDKDQLGPKSVAKRTMAE
jgi:hypothetical protein